MVFSKRGMVLIGPIPFCAEAKGRMVKLKPPHFLAQSITPPLRVKVTVNHENIFWEGNNAIDAHILGPSKPPKQPNPVGNGRRFSYRTSTKPQPPATAAHIWPAISLKRTVKTISSSEQPVVPHPTRKPRVWHHLAFCAMPLMVVAPKENRV